MSAEPIPFPENCPRGEWCKQETRLEVLEDRAQDRDDKLTRMESKLDALFFAILAAAVAIIGALLKR